MCALLHVTMTSSHSRYATSSSTQTAIPLQILLCIWQRSWPVMVWEEFYQIHLLIWLASPLTRSWSSSSAIHWMVVASSSTTRTDVYHSGRCFHREQGLRCWPFESDPSWGLSYGAVPIDPNWVKWGLELTITRIQDPYWTTSIMESKRVFFVAQLFFSYFSSAPSDLENPRNFWKQVNRGYEFFRRPIANLLLIRRNWKPC